MLIESGAQSLDAMGPLCREREPGEVDEEGGEEYAA